MTNPNKIFRLSITETAETIPDLEARFTSRLNRAIPGIENCTVTLVQNGDATPLGTIGTVTYYECTRIYEVNLEPPVEIVDSE